MPTSTIPLAARQAAPPRLAETSVEGVAWDTERQLNVQADGTPWHTTDHAASCTDTNLDGQGDDTNDPYFAPAS